MAHKNNGLHQSASSDIRSYLDFDVNKSPSQIMEESAIGNGSSNIEGPSATGTSSGLSWEDNGNLSVISSSFSGLENSAVFKFFLHDNMDYDSTGTRYDRQRIEIKGDGNQSDVLALEDDILTYHWKFMLEENLPCPPDPVVTNFFHIFQIKAIEGVENTLPIFTYTVMNTDLVFQHIAISGNGMGKANILGRTPISSIEGKWLEANVTILYRDDGYVYMTLYNISDPNSPVLLMEAGEVVDSFRRPEAEDSSGVWYETNYPATLNQRVRSKWGLYRKIYEIEDGFAEAAMQLGDLEILKRERSSYRFDDGFDPSTLPSIPERDVLEDGGTNWALHSGADGMATIKTSTQSGADYLAKNLIDGSMETTWRTHSSQVGLTNLNGKYWVSIDLGEERTIDKLWLQFGTTGNRLINYDIYWSNSDNAYEELTEGASVAANATPDPLLTANGYNWQLLVGVHLGEGKFIKSNQMDIYTSEHFQPIQARYLLISGDTIHVDSGTGAINTIVFKAIETIEEIINSDSDPSVLTTPHS